MSVKYKVIAGSTRILNAASSTARTLSTAVKGTILDIESNKVHSYSWLKLNGKHNGSTAYVAKNDVVKVENKSSIEDTKPITEDFSSKAKLIMDTFIYKEDSYSSNKGVNTSTGLIIKKGELVNITKKSTNGFYYITKTNSANRAGWISMGAVNITNSKGKTTVPVDKKTVEYQQALDNITTYYDDLSSYREVLLDAYNYTGVSKSKKLDKDTSTAKGILVKSLNGIHGVPYQFMDNVDRRQSSNHAIGRKYAEKIVSKMPLLLMTPGSPDFLPTYNKNETNVILDTLINGIDKTVGRGNLDKILSTSGRYYTFRFEYDEYYQYVNGLLHQCAIYLGLQNQVHANGYGKGYSDKLGEFRWDKAVNRELRGFINAQEYVAFYLDSESSVSESISTSTSNSRLMDGVNDFHNEAKELQFLAGPIAGLRAEALNAEDYDATMADIRSLSNKYLGNSKLFNSLAEQFTTIGKGGKISFPEIWDDTEFSKSYDINIKLRTPDGDKLSWYLNICVPLIHLLGMGASRSLGPNGYRSPFLVRAYYKGLFNCDMGIITSMNISKGKEGEWTADGLPTEVDVNIQLKDLYSMLSITNVKHGVKNFLNNTCLMDYLANTCGVNINKPEIQRTLETYVLLTKNNIQDIYGDAWLSLQNGLSNLANNAYKKFASQTN